MNNIKTPHSIGKIAFAVAMLLIISFSMYALYSIQMNTTVKSRYENMTTLEFKEGELKRLSEPIKRTEEANHKKYAPKNNKGNL